MNHPQILIRKSDATRPLKISEETISDHSLYSTQFFFVLRKKISWKKKEMSCRDHYIQAIGQLSVARINLIGIQPLIAILTRHPMVLEIPYCKETITEEGLLRVIFSYKIRSEKIGKSFGLTATNKCQKLVFARIIIDEIVKSLKSEISRSDLILAQSPDLVLVDEIYQKRMSPIPVYCVFLQ